MLPSVGPASWKFVVAVYCSLKCTAMDCKIHVAINKMKQSHPLGAIITKKGFALLTLFKEAKLRLVLGGVTSTPIFCPKDQ